MRTTVLICLLLGLTLAIRTTHRHSAKLGHRHTAKHSNLYKHHSLHRQDCDVSGDALLESTLGVDLDGNLGLDGVLNLDGSAGVSGTVNGVIDATLHLCDHCDDPFECRGAFALCQEYFGISFDVCETSWHALEAFKHDCVNELNDCDFEAFLAANIEWYPSGDAQAVIDAEAWLATHPLYGWVDINDPVIANAPDFCHEDYDVIWQCGYEA